MKEELMNSLKRRRQRKDRYERLSNQALGKGLAFNSAPVPLSLMERVGFRLSPGLGDASGDASQSTIDSILAANLATRPNRGLASYSLIDPSVITDV